MLPYEEGRRNWCLLRRIWRNGIGLQMYQSRTYETLTYLRGRNWA